MNTAAKYLFIDIDNTILDFDLMIEEGIADGFRTFKLGDFDKSKMALFHEINDELWQALERKEITFEDIKRTRFNRLFATLGIEFDGLTFENRLREFIHEYAEPVIGAGDFLSRLSSKYQLCAASNGPEEQQNHRLALAGFAKYFTYVFVSEGLGHSKPNVEFFTEAFKRMEGRVDASECIMIGDSLSSDMKGGQNIGMRTIFFNKHHKDISSSSVKPDIYFDSLQEIADYLLN